jgi:hypothetical protein
MPHCNKQMISFFLTTNWFADKIIVAVGNEKEFAGEALNIV